MAFAEPFTKVFGAFAFFSVHPRSPWNCQASVLHATEADLISANTLKFNRSLLPSRSIFVCF